MPSHDIKALKASATPDRPPSKARELWDTLRLVWWPSACPAWLYYTVPRLWYAHVASRLFPRQRWLTKTIPRQWQDKPELLAETIYTFVRHYVGQDGEDALNRVEWEEADAAMLREIYGWATTGRAAAFAAISAAYPPMRSFPKESVADWIAALNVVDPTRAAAYAEVDRLEKAMEETDDRYLTWVVVNRGKLWT